LVSKDLKQSIKRKTQDDKDAQEGPPMPARPEEVVDEEGFGGFSSGGLGHIKNLWKFTQPPVNKVHEKKVDELTGGGGGYVVTGPRNYGMKPPGPNTAGPSVQGEEMGDDWPYKPKNSWSENKKSGFEFIPRKAGQQFVLDIKRDGKLLHTITGKSKEEVILLGKEWVSRQKTEKKVFKKMLEKYLE